MKTLGHPRRAAAGAREPGDLRMHTCKDYVDFRVILEVYDKLDLTDLSFPIKLGRKKNNFKVFLWEKNGSWKQNSHVSGHFSVGGPGPEVPASPPNYI